MSMRAYALRSANTVRVRMKRVLKNALDMSDPIYAIVDDTRPGEPCRRYRRAVLVPHGEHGMLIEDAVATHEWIAERVKRGVSNVEEMLRYLSGSYPEDHPVYRNWAALE
jgi:hypothetical protein